MSYLGTAPSEGGEVIIGGPVVDANAYSVLFTDINSDLSQSNNFLYNQDDISAIIGLHMDADLGKNQYKQLIGGDRKTFGELNFFGIQGSDSDTYTNALFGLADTTDVLGALGSTNSMFGQGSSKAGLTDEENAGIILNSGNILILQLEKIDTITDDTKWTIGISGAIEDKKIGFEYVNDLSGSEAEIRFGLTESLVIYEDLLNGNSYSLPDTFPTADNQVISVTDFTTGQTEWKSPTFTYDDTTKNIYSLNSGGGTVTGNDNFIVGEDAGLGATGVVYSNFIGKEAGAGAVNAISSNFLGYQSGYGGTGAYYSNFFGNQAGYGATDATYSTFIGNQAGYEATDATYSTFIGTAAGYNAPSAGGSVFIGDESGRDALAASSSVFLGNQSGISAENAENSVFLGFQSGYQAINAINSIFIGNQSGFQDTIDNLLGGSSILIGINTSTGGFSNSIAIGNEAVNTEEYQFMIGSGANPIDSIVITGTKTPASATDTGTKGTVCWDENYVYVCIDTDTWKRIAIATW
jgi:hypothetical protein